ncbi:MAG: hypothetical protein IJ000_00525 [Paludibacteraceae bacterium]|nr:hypothetical protein [Paludibacteraceae bacterium]
MKRVFSTILLLLVLSFSYPIFSQQRNVVINTSSVDRTVITTDPDVDIWTQLEQERIAAERAEQERIAAERAEQARIAAERAEQARIAAENAEQERIAAERVEQERIAAENAEQAHIADKKGTQPIAITNDFQTKCAQIHKQIIKLSEHYYGGQVLKKYNNIYKSMPQTEENMLNLQKIQYVVISYLNSKGSAYPTLEKELKNAASVEEEIAFFLSYYKEQ